MTFIRVVLTQQDNKEKYNSEHIGRLVTDLRSFDNKHYICGTCDFKVKKSQVPCQAVYNKLYLDDSPIGISCLNHLELFLIFKRFYLKKDHNHAKRTST